MRSRYRFNTEHAAYFITATIVNWLPVFTTAPCCEAAVNALKFAQKEKQLRIYAWVILDNHMHAIVSGPAVSKTIRELKQFTAHRLLAQIKSDGRDWLLNQLAYYRAAHKRTAGYQHQVWQEGVHPQAISSDAMMYQKLEYLHLNPVRRGLVASPEHWRFSSAHVWLDGAAPLLRCDSWR